MKLHFVAGEQAWRHLFFTALCPDGWQTHCCHSGGQELEENGRWRTVRLVPQVMCCPQGNVADGPLVDPVTNELALHWWRHHTLVYLLNVRRNLQKKRAAKRHLIHYATVSAYTALDASTPSHPVVVVVCCILFLSAMKTGVARHALML